MASIARDPNGRRRILFVAPDGSRKTIRLGKLDQRTAEAVCRHVEALLAASISGQPVPRETAVWLNGIGRDLRRRLVRVGLLQRREVVRLGDLVDEWFSLRAGGLQPGTRVRLQQSRRSLLGFFGPDRPIGTINEGHAEDFRAALLAEGLAEATVRKRCSDAVVVPLCRASRLDCRQPV